MKVSILEEESTSVFVPNFDRESIDIMPSVQNEGHIVNPAIMGKLRYLSRPFQKQAYKPLQFVLESGNVKGEIQKMDDDILWIETDDMITEIEIRQIEDILWRGQPFDTRA